MKFYEVKLKHDSGHITITVVAENKKAARELIMRVEKCPARSITSIKEAM